ncbi:MAG TPA: hypothetical protein VGL91_14590 [Acidobacteriota bacterium]|jgi:hypothetical protein
MKLEELLQHVQPRWHKAFLHFVETGEAESEFLDYLNQDKDSQQAVEMAFNAQAEAFQGLAEELKRAPEVAIAAVPAREPAVVSAKMAEAVEGALELPPDQRDEVLEKTALTLEASLRPSAQKQLRELVENLGNALEKVAFYK